MQSFYQDGIFQLEGAHGHYTKENVDYLMCHLPTLFAYLEENNITKLHLCCTTSYGGYNNTLRNFYIKEEIKLFCEDLLELLSKNKTLDYCNLGLFQGLLTNEELEEAVALHPSLTYVSMNAPRATTDFRQAPTTLYRDKVEDVWKMYWAHFRAV